MQNHELETVSPDDADSALVLLDQTELPNRVVYLRLHTTEEIREAICSLRVRGAPAIGVAAACGLYLAAKQAAEAHTNFGILSLIHIWVSKKILSSIVLLILSYGLLYRASR